jgi:WhiB family redox-sensing transcriptional regulator
MSSVGVAHRSVGWVTGGNQIPPSSVNSDEWAVKTDTGGGAMDDLLSDTTEFIPIPITEERPWAVFSACREKDPDLFFPEDRKAATEALAICATCTVRVDCLEYAIEADIRYGVWGGLTDRQRRRFVRELAS